jgi:hypothetical protein
VGPQTPRPTEAGFGTLRCVPDPASWRSGAAADEMMRGHHAAGSVTMRGVPHLPEQLRCDRCARTGTAAEVATGWSVSTPPRPTGSTHTAADGPIAMLCPDCARRLVRDLEARLDP